MVKLFENKTVIEMFLHFCLSALCETHSSIIHKSCCYKVHNYFCYPTHLWLNWCNYIKCENWNCTENSSNSI